MFMFIFSIRLFIEVLEQILTEHSYRPGTNVGARDIAMNKTDIDLRVLLIFSWRITVNKQNGLLTVC